MIYDNPVPTMLRGILRALRAVEKTYGSRGRHVLVERPGGQFLTMDGASVLWACSWAHPVEQMGLRLLQDACHAVSQSVGDGTSTTALITASAVENGWKMIQAGDAAPFLQKRWTAWAENLVVDHEVGECSPADLKRLTDKALHHDPDAAVAVVQAILAAGTQGILDVTPGHGRDVVMEKRPGYQLDRGVESQESLGLEAMRVIETPLVALVDGILTRLAHVESLLEEATAFPNPLVIVSRGCFGEALKTVLTNDRRLVGGAGLPVEWVPLQLGGTTPHQRDILEDLQAISGATIMDPSWGYGWSPDWFGSVQRIVASRGKSSWTMYPQEDVLDRIEKRILALGRQSGLSGDMDRLRRRKAMLSDGYVDLRVGGESEMLQKERLSRVEDAVHMGRTALLGGIIRSCPYSTLSEKAPDSALRRALSSPLLWGGDDEAPAMVVEAVVKTAVSTAAMILGSACAITTSCCNRT